MTINSTPKDANAVSYLSVAEADDYFGGKFGADGWTALTTANKEKLLVSATRQIDTFVFGGRKTSADQALEWPRQGLFDREGRTINQETCPKKLKSAACELAYWYLTEEDRLLSDTEIQQVDSYQAGPLNVKVAANKIVFPKMVEQLLNSIGPGVLLSTSGAAESGAAVTQSVRMSR